MKKGIIIGIILVVIIAIGGFVVINNNKQDTTEPTKETVANEASQNTVNEFQFTYEGKKIAINEEMDKEKLGEEKSFYEVPSCAFEGMDKIYEYEHFEVETYSDNNVERIYSIYTDDVKTTTTEGVCVSDSYDKMVEVYGEDFENEGTQYTYTKGDTCLEFIIENDTIISIKYVLKTELK